MVILETKDLKKQYGTGDTAVHALAGVNLSVENGEFVAIVGTSGSGKSTLLHMLGGLDRATSGKVYVDGKDIFSLKDEELTIFRRRKIGFVFQAFNLVPVLSVYENIVLPLQLDGRTIDETYLNQIVEACRKSYRHCPTSCPVDSSRGWRLPGRLRRSRQSFLQMNRPEILTAGLRRMSWGC